MEKINSQVCCHAKEGLKLKNSQRLYTCNGCGEEGFGSRHSCDNCNYNLHEACMFPTLNFSHKLFEESTFKFFEKSPTPKSSSPNCKKKHEKNCDACKKPIKGCLYQSENDKFYLHPTCMNLNNEIILEGTKLQLQKNKINVSEKSCMLCKNTKRKAEDYSVRDQGLSYVSENEDLKFHVRCLSEWMLESLRTKGGNGKLLKKNKMNNNGDGRLVRKKKNLPIHRKKRNEKKSLWLKIIKILIEAIACALLGDPVSFASLAIELIK